MYSLRTLCRLLLPIALLAIFTHTAQAENRAYTCYLEGNAKGLSISIGFGAQIIRGNGIVRCQSGSRVITRPVKIRFYSAGIGFELAYIKSMRIRSSKIRIYDGPEGLIGEYDIGATAGVTLLNQGIDFDAAIEVTSSDGFGFEVAMIGKDVYGLGAKLHGMIFAIKAR